MKIPKNVVALLNTQFKAELEASYLYLSMSNALHHFGYDGFAKRMRLQANEEKEHAMKIFDYMVSRNEQAHLDTIAAPTAEWPSITAVFENVYAHECLVTTMVYDLCEKAATDKDYATVSFMQWFVDEQVEEEKQALDFLMRIKEAQVSPAALLTLDELMLHTEK